MPIIQDDDYKPPFLLRNGHTNTIYTYYKRKNNTVPFVRQREITLDDDFVDIDWIKSNSQVLVILLHGLEGSSSSQYIVGLCKALKTKNVDIAVLNFRGCSGQINLKQYMYHSGWTYDLHHFIQKYEQNYTDIAICGFSLGGNVTMKYIGDRQNILSPKIKVACGVSVPCDLKNGSYKIMERQNFLYENRFLNTLIPKALEKSKQFPGLIDTLTLKKIKTLFEFDNQVTAPLHGFKDALDYYEKCNSLQFLHNIEIPSIIISALDDSFLAQDSYPYEIAKKNPYLFLTTPKHGGHVGFYTKKSSTFWHEKQLLDFMSRYIKQINTP